ncbi:methylaspartate mutase [candidate division TA06 bacterium DG_78]|uniref:Methylaspartate mutase n=1 Tax=candidate division TA06 bacterium DG_78 TaxID=1703772 RepID=A0A0S7Y9Y1_UNCT6|nr:MAG: methylaspartate mutase [candidate division TA06 bacterium DG_78]
MKGKEPKRILATDCGSTTTKAILIEKRGEEYRLIVRGEAPTTVEAPYEDVTKGVLNAVREVEELSKVRILDGEHIIKTVKNGEGVDFYVSTSSAGGGLQMMVAGVVLTMTAESAARAALGAGAIVMDVIASNDGRLPHEKIERIRNLRPDMILLSGGIDGGTISHVVELAELIKAADPRPRFGVGYQLPVIYAGNKEARDIILKTLKEKTALVIVENIRPVLERENLNPARQKIHDQFMEHVMAHAPGYKQLMERTDVPIMPTPGAVGLLVETVAKKEKIQVIGVDIGGATTDVFSVFQEVFNRTVSANLGMSYSISNVLAETGVDNIIRWLPMEIEEWDLRNRIRNKMIRPTTIPHSLEDLKIEQAIAREALRLAFVQHKSMAVGLKGIQQARTISDVFDQSMTGETLIDLMGLHLIIGSGGILSHAPRRNQAALMMIDAFQPEGITRIAVDSIFMMPHLGVLLTVHEQSATEVFNKDCLIPLGSCIAPVGEGKLGANVLKYTVEYTNGKTDEGISKYGDISLLPLGVGETAKIILHPEKGFDVGEGRGKELETTVNGGVVGLIIDCRGRPFMLPEDNHKRMELLNTWFNAMNLYPRK